MNKTFQSSKRQGPAINNKISAKSVRVISEKGDMLGVFNTDEAIKLAFEKGLDHQWGRSSSLMALGAKEL